MYTVDEFKKYCKEKDLTKKIKCPICEKEYAHKGLWTHINRTHNKATQYSSGYNGCYDEVSVKVKQFYANKKAIEIEEFHVTCEKCNKIFTVKEHKDRHPIKEKYFCSRKCANIREHNKETKKKISKGILQYLEKHGSCGPVKYSDKPKEIRLCRFCGEELEWDNRRVYCNSKCKKNFRYKDKTEYELYKRECWFNFSLKDYPEEFDFDLIRKYGWYSAANRGNNLDGVSRDHMISITYGWKNKISPEIISHPANCCLVRHSENLKKMTSCSISLNDLMKRIDEWDKKYKSLK